MKTFLVGMVIAGAIGLAEVLVKFDPNAITDWRTWVLMATGAFVRPAAAYVVTNLPRILRNG